MNLIIIITMIITNSFSGVSLLFGFEIYISLFHFVVAYFLIQISFYCKY